MADKAGKDYPRHTVRLPGEYTEKIASLQDLYKCNKSILFRMGIDALLSQESPLPTVAGIFSGTPEIVAIKWEFIRQTLEGKPVCMAARAAGATRSEVYKWLSEDSKFMEFAQDAKDESIEKPEHVVWHKAVNEKNLNACFGILNAHHSQYGMVKAGYIEAKFKKMLREKVLPLVQKYLSRDNLSKFAGELRQLTP